jgi:hypothetical protein
MQDLKIDPQRAADYPDSTGYYVRAVNDNGAWLSSDISTLDRDSLLAWLRADPMRAESVLLKLMGH